ncbi:macrolide 2'-phosphotransferase [Micromonospora sp. NPDC049645]|uniref:macrolide 2'-phosphotransferase n=1 Tax=Micromonospora sp. NPDC049645 TaxID=3155508 RepID=UPI0034314F6B
MPDTSERTWELLRLAADRGLTLRPETAVLDDTGWDFQVLRAATGAGREWILRVPRRAEVATAARAEQRLLALLRGRFAVAIPDWSIADSELIAYPRLAGEPAASEDITSYELVWRIDRVDPPAAYVDRLGAFMAELHATPVDAAAATGIPVRDADGVRGRFAVQIDRGGQEFGMHPSWRDRASRWLQRDDLWADRTVLIHGDLHPGHTLVDPAGALTGVLDWTDAEVGDPGQEFVEAARKFPPVVLDRLVAAYGRHDGPAWPGLRGHVTEAIAFAPLALGILGLEAGKQRYVDRAREYFGTPTV